MSVKKWITRNTASLKGKTVAITGSTGGLGQEICKTLASLGANLIFIDRNRERSSALGASIQNKFPNCEITYLTADLEDFESVKKATHELLKLPIDFFLHNAGAYKIPRKTCSTGFDNVFQINFVSPYYMIRTLLPTLKNRGGKVLAVSSIALGYSRTDKNDIDFKNRSASSLLYGNAKRFLTFSLYELFEGENDVTLSIVHPGITLTNITAHYPKIIFSIIKYPMKVIFMNPKKASLSIIKGFFEDCNAREWIGPRFFNIWGLPKKKKLTDYSIDEVEFIANKSSEIYTLLYKNSEKD